MEGLQDPYTIWLRPTPTPPGASLFEPHSYSRKGGKKATVVPVTTITGFFFAEIPKASRSSAGAGLEIPSEEDSPRSDSNDGGSPSPGKSPRPDSSSFSYAKGFFKG